MKLKAINCKNMGAILVHQRKPDGAHTDLVAEVHSGIKDAEYIAACVNAAAAKSEAWPEDVADYPSDPAIIQGGVVSAAFNHAREQFGVMPDMVVVKPVEPAGRIPDLIKEQLRHFMAIAVHHQHCRLSAEAERDELLAAIESLLDGVDLQAPEGFTPDNADGVLCARTVCVFDLIRCAQILERAKKGGAE